jgi:hypothetical protein
VEAIAGAPLPPPLGRRARIRILKHHFGLVAIRVRGIERVRLHADLIMLARLGQALSRVRAVSLAA